MESQIESASICSNPRPCSVEVQTAIRLHTLIGALIFLITIGLIMVRPRRITEAIAAAGGALLMLLGGYVGLGEAITILRSQWNVYGFFLGLMMISALADEAGVFEVMTNRIARWSKGSALRLYVAIFLIGTLITAFLSNDATALILTPIVYVLVTRLRLAPLPFLFACTFIADTAAVALICISAREGSEGHPHIGPASVGHTARFVLDNAPCDVLLLRDA